MVPTPVCGRQRPGPDPLVWREPHPSACRAVTHWALAPVWRRLGHPAQVSAFRFPQLPGAPRSAPKAWLQACSLLQETLSP